MEVPAPAAGVLREILLDTDAEAVPGAVLGRIAPVAEVDSPGSPAEAGAKPRQQQAGPRHSPGNSPGQELRLSPSVRRALLQHDIDPSRIEGTGRDGRITRADVDRAVAAATKVQEGPRTTAQPKMAEPSDASIRSHNVPHDRMRLKIAEHMLNSVTRAPHVTAMFEADFSAIIAHREAHKAAWAKKGVKLTYSAY